MLKIGSARIFPIVEICDFILRSNFLNFYILSPLLPLNLWLDFEKLMHFPFKTSSHFDCLNLTINGRGQVTQHMRSSIHNKNNNNSRESETITECRGLQFAFCPKVKPWQQIYRKTTEKSMENFGVPPPLLLSKISNYLKNRPAEVCHKRFGHLTFLILQSCLPSL